MESLLFSPIDVGAYKTIGMVEYEFGRIVFITGQTQLQNPFCQKSSIHMNMLPDQVRLLTPRGTCKHHADCIGSDNAQKAFHARLVVIDDTTALSPR